jgi:predicted ferric reductase
MAVKGSGGHDGGAVARSSAAPSRPAPQGGSGLRPGDVVAILAANAVLLCLMWMRHGGLGLLGTPAGALTGLGEVTALVGTYGALVQLVLMSRIPWFERLLGLDGLARWHRVTGFTTISLILAHVLLTTVGVALADHVDIAAEFVKFITTYPYVLMATVATGLFVLVALTSMRWARRRLEHETWHFIHLYVYLAIVLAFGHELAVGNDFVGDGLAVAYWLALYIAAFGAILGFRVVAPLRFSLRHRLRVAGTVRETEDVVSIYLEGRDLDDFRARGGQFFLWRFLTPKGWWRAHPFSLSAAPNEHWLRITVKDVGKGSREVHDIATGTRVLVEGPYGRFTTLPSRRSRVALIAGGIGITPVRSLLEDLPAGKGDIVIIYRARRPQDVVFQVELEELARQRKATLHLLVGRRSEFSRDPLSASRLQELIPDIKQRDVYVCGPPGMLATVQSSLDSIGLPRSRLHAERFALLQEPLR